MNTKPLLLSMPWYNFVKFNTEISTWNKSHKYLSVWSKNRRNSVKCSFYVKSTWITINSVSLYPSLLDISRKSTELSMKLLTYYMYSKVISIVRVYQQETAVWIIRLTLRLGFYCIKLSDIKSVADVVATVPAVAKYTAWRFNRKLLSIKRL